MQVISSKANIHTYKLNLYELKYFDSKDVIGLLKLSVNLNTISSLIAENNDSDLIPNEYEGKYRSAYSNIYLNISTVEHRWSGWIGLRPHLDY